MGISGTQRDDRTTPSDRGAVHGDLRMATMIVDYISFLFVIALGILIGFTFGWFLKEYLDRSSHKKMHERDERHRAGKPSIWDF